MISIFIGILLVLHEGLSLYLMWSDRRHLKLNDDRYDDELRILHFKPKVFLHVYIGINVNAHY